ncbi:PadR family transcriptional regulator [Streptococcus mitis]|uniref:PadR family transcriptional regulator n=1 Tax=Streptococcus mitis TaxID=28037 RepID=UPI0021B5725E
MELTDKIRRVYLPMTETGFYILFCLQKGGHGYSITQKVKEMTDSQVSISPGTMYGTLSKMEKDGLISFVREEEKRKIYQITDLGRKVLDIELKRIERLHRNSREEV